ncbi:hypothetical protein NDU88_004586 [Pleurodeles waltl]|uniref:Uncharacterized protein n=1 Tax=Pleurodeles waltl TaxID=8319 RepID=A0AAV7LK94_PLEWA|nr:hypothetical protein NDU88_004586 [Pleurodeles waltl]
MDRSPRDQAGDGTTWSGPPSKWQPGAAGGARDQQLGWGSVAPSCMKRCRPSLTRCRMREEATWWKEQPGWRPEEIREERRWETVGLGARAVSRAYGVCRSGLMCASGPEEKRVAAGTSGPL